MEAKYEAMALMIDRGALLAHAGAILRILADGTNPQRASDAAQHSAANLERLLEASSQGMPPVACAKGCALCCHNWVTATAPEIFFLARTVREDPTAEARIRAAAALSAGMGHAQRIAGAAACALLHDNLCGAYAARPLVCRTYVSASLAACQAVFAGAPEPIPMPGNFVGLRVAHNHALWAALQAAGLSDASYELNAALERIVGEEGAEGRWLAGEEVFAGIATDLPDDAAAADFTRGLAAELLSAA